MQRMSLPPATVLRSGEDWEFQLQILGYEYPDITAPGEDSNWLMVSLRARFPGGMWQAADPCLLTWEVSKLAAWFHAISHFYEPIAIDRIRFKEGTLAFEVASRSNETITLRIRLKLAVAPEWTPGHSTHIDGTLEIQLSSYDLQTSAASLLTQLNRFPPRGEEEDAGQSTHNRELPPPPDV